MESVDVSQSPHDAPEMSEVIMTGAEKLRQQGREQGREQGLAQGRETGRRELLRKLLALKFGPLPAAAEARIDGADIPELDRFSERVLTASSLDGVFLPSE